MRRSLVLLTVLGPLLGLVACAQTHPERGPAVDDTRQSFRARGNEPGWRLDIEGDRMTFVAQDGRRFATATPAPQRTDAFTRYVARADGTDLTVTIFSRRCKDAMSGMPYPNAVEVVYGDRKLAGCGGDPAKLLQGREWVVEDIGGKGIVDNSRATLDFGADGRLAGRGSCNNYFAQYTLTGEGLTVARAGATMMACAPALMDQEGLFLEILRNVRRFDLGEDGALVLRTDDGRTITARR
jgi:heat shock protein HslJ